MTDKFIKGRDKNQILGDLIDIGQPGSEVHEQQKMAIIVRCTEDLEKAVDRLRESLAQSASSADKLSNRVFWLNVVITLATVAGVVVAILK